ncbi:MAG: leucine-rich repeat domain-containing protein [Treponema sp.]|nr:leucine-rich repeat domain-containing protein [Treponema sp.]
MTSIGQYAFYNCSGLTSVTIPDSVTSIDSSAFSGCSGLTSINVESGNTAYRSEGNCLIQISNNRLISGCKNSIIPDSVTSIGQYAFYNCRGLTSITIPSGVTSIGSSAFYDCRGLTSVTLGAISSANFSSDYSFPSFPGDLRTKYFAAGGGAGTYVRAGGLDSWTKQ